MILGISFPFFHITKIQRTFLYTKYFENFFLCYKTYFLD